MWTTTDLVASVKRRASVPTTQALLAAQDFLDVATEEMNSYVVPLVIQSHTERMVTEVDQLLAGQTTFRMPTRAIGGNLREVQLVDSAGRFLNVPQLPVSALDRASFGFYVKGNTLNLWNSLQALSTSYVSLRMSYYTRPNALVYPTSCGTVLSFLSNAITLTGAPPAGFVNGALYDVVRAQPGFECLATNVTGNVAGNVVTLSLPVTDLAAGDYVCLAGQSPVPQIPAELHPLLAQAITVKVLQAIGDSEGLNSAAALLGRMEKDAVSLIANRVEGEALRVVNRSSIFRTVF